MSVGSLINLNGSLVPADQPVLMANNRSFRYGDGLFETLRISDEGIRLESYHVERFFSGLRILGFHIPAYFTPDWISNQIKSLCEINGHLTEGRVRLTAYRGNGSLQQPDSNIPNILIESFELNSHHPGLLRMTIYQEDFKSTGLLSNLKSNNYLIYAMAAKQAQIEHCDECFVLNQYNRICDASTANIFLVHAGFVSTPSLSEGCVAGVMRRHLLTMLPSLNVQVKEEQITRERVLEAEEIFLTNALHPIRMVESFQGKQYSQAMGSWINKNMKWK